MVVSIAPKSRASRAPSTHEWRQASTPNGELFTKTDSETGDVTTYSYDGLGNLLHVDLPDGRLVEYVIDGQNRRIGKIVDGILQKAWLYKDQLKPIAELDGSGNLTARFVYGSKTNTPDVILKYNGGVVTTYRVISDHLGSPVMAVNVNNVSDVPFKAEYSAFGERTVTTGAASEDWMPFGFADGLHDADTGLTRFGARDYDAEIGRWTAKDPIRWDRGSWNLFGYSAGDPVNRIDTTGMYFCNFTGQPLLVGGGTGEGKGHSGQFGTAYLPDGQCVGPDIPIDTSQGKLYDVDVADFNGDGQVKPPMNAWDSWPLGEKVPWGDARNKAICAVDISPLGGSVPVPTPL